MLFTTPIVTSPVQAQVYQQRPVPCSEVWFAEEPDAAPVKDDQAVLSAAKPQRTSLFDLRASRRVD